MRGNLISTLRFQR